MAPQQQKLLEAGDNAPDFNLESHDGSAVSLKQFKGKGDVVLFFYPKANTGG